jgi:hypothetical protein
MRVSVPEGIAAEVLFRQDRICCVCQEPGKRLQIHHIDGNPSNNSESNLAALCFDCHDDTQISGGFGRKLNAVQVTKCRDDWLQRIADIRKGADELLLKKQLGVINAATSTKTSNWVRPSDLELAVYIESIPDTMKKAHELAKPDWDNGATNVVAQATYRVIRVAERLWVGLSAWFPPKHFGNKDAAEYVSEYIEQRYELRYALLEPDGPGTGGTMMRPMAAYGVLLDVQDTISLTVEKMLTFLAPNSHIDFEKWREKFVAGTRSQPR